MASFGPVSSDATSGEATVAGGSANGPLWPGDLIVGKSAVTVVLGADYEAYGVVHKTSVGVVLGADYNEYGVVNKTSAAVVLGNDTNLPGTITKSTVSVVLEVYPGNLDQAALHVVTGHAPGAFGLVDQSVLHVVTGHSPGSVGLLEQAALHVVLTPVQVVATQVLSINT